MAHLPILPVALPLLAAVVSVGAGPLVPRRLLEALGLLTAGCTLAACLALAGLSADGPIVYWLGGWPPRGTVVPGIALVVDPLGAGLAALAATLVTASLTFSWRYFEVSGGLYHALVLIFLAASTGFCLTGDLFNLFVFFELMSAAAYALTGHKIEEEQSLEGALNFAVVNSVGAFLVLIGIALLYGRTGALNLAQIGHALAGGPADGLVVAAFVLITAGLCVKAALVPFHFWLPDAHAVAPTPVSVLFSGFMVTLGLYGVARVYWTAFSGPLRPHGEAVGGVLLAGGAVTALLGGVMCVAQRHIKRLLAFSTISHMGLVLIGVALCDRRALAGAGLYAVGHGLVKGSLFLGAGILLHRWSSVDECALRGRGRGCPLSGAAFVLAALGLAGCPPFATCGGWSLIERAARDAGHDWVTPVEWVAASLTAGAALRVAGRVFGGWGPAEPARHDGDQRETAATAVSTPWSMRAPTWALAVLGATVGLVPGLSERAQTAAGRFVDRAAYEAAVFGARPPGAASAPAAPANAAERPADAVAVPAAVPAALGVALVALSPQRVPRGLRYRLGRVWQPVGVVLRIAHSGKVGDYVTWLVVGVAVLGAAMRLLVR
jgi:multicomponent Na+:H+ antiporter subunit D